MAAEFHDVYIAGLSGPPPITLIYLVLCKQIKVIRNAGTIIFGNCTRDNHLAAWTGFECVSFKFETSTATSLMNVFRSLAFASFSAFSPFRML